MTKIRLTAETLSYFSIFENVTGFPLKDCIIKEDKIIFVVKENIAARAAGKAGANIKRLEKLIRKKVKLVEFNQDIKKFILNLIYPIIYRDIEVTQQDNSFSIILFPKDMRDKALLIGKERRNLIFLKDTLNRYFNIKEINIQ